MLKKKKIKISLLTRGIKPPTSFYFYWKVFKLSHWVKTHIFYNWQNLIYGSETTQLVKPITQAAHPWAQLGHFNWTKLPFRFSSKIHQSSQCQNFPSTQTDKFGVRWSPLQSSGDLFLWSLSSLSSFFGFSAWPVEFFYSISNGDFSDNLNSALTANASQNLSRR